MTQRINNLVYKIKMTVRNSENKSRTDNKNKESLAHAE